MNSNIYHLFIISAVRCNVNDYIIYFPICPDLLLTFFRYFYVAHLYLYYFFLFSYDEKIQ